MVRFTLFCRTRDEDIRMEVANEDHVTEIGCTASDCFGGGLMLRNGYRLLDPGSCVGECVHDRDVIEAIPDPETLFSTFGMRRPWTG